MSLIMGLLLSTSVLASSTVSHDEHTSTAGEARQAAQAFDDANQRMHHGMAIESSGSVDMDFARGMLAHHRGAVDMARIELEHGHDEQMRKLARDVMDAQQQEIELLKRWIGEHDDKTSEKTH